MKGVVFINISKIKQPAVKWTGSKRKVASYISEFFPKHKCFFEPFLGGGSVILHSDAERKIGSDSFLPLIQIWNLIKSNPNELINKYTILWEKLQSQGHTYYYEVREHFNQTKDPISFFFLTRTCFNGTIRFSKEGKFNTSFHLTRKGIQPEKLSKIIMDWNLCIQNINFLHSDYTQINNHFDEDKYNNLVYCDPPYLRANSFYFEQFDYERFYNWLDDLSLQGVKWIVSFDSEIPNMQKLAKKEIIINNQYSSYKSLNKNENFKFKDSLYFNF